MGSGFLRRYAPLVMLMAVGVVACKREPSRADVRETNKDLAKSLVSSIEAAKALVDAAPQQTEGAPCEKKGLSLDIMPETGKAPTAGNTNIAGVRELLPSGTVDADGPSYKGALADALYVGKPSGSAVLLGAWLRYKAPDYSPQDLSTSGAQEAAAFARVPGITNLVILRPAPANNQRADVFLLDFPTVKLVCGFGVVADVAEKLKKENDLGYDMATGEPLKEAKSASYDEIIKNVTLNVAREVQSRFGLSVFPDKRDLLAGPPPGPALDKVRAHFNTVLGNLKAQVPECTSAPPAGAVRTTTKRLTLAAGASPLGKDEPNVRVEAAELISPSFKEFLAADRKPQGALGTKLTGAPAMLVLDVAVYHAAVFAALEKKFTPGAIVVRQVRLDAEGKAVCATAAQFTNSPRLKVGEVWGYSSEASQNAAADGDLREQIEAYFGDAMAFASMPGASAAAAGGTSAPAAASASPAPKR